MKSPTKTPDGKSKPDLEYLEFLPKKHNARYVVWQNADECALCSVEFSKLSVSAHRRTHCRRCGNSVCRPCCTNEMPLSKETINSPEKVCDKCCAEIENLHIKAFYRKVVDIERINAVSLDDQA